MACFEGGEKNWEIAAALRVSERSVERWRRQWRENGHARVGWPPRGHLADLDCPTGRWPGWSESWSAVRCHTAGPISGGPWRG
ncbi:helix-turn-helix domain-containing protein [Streptomyces maoxianensis]|uniref:helix-turn-helix domain-containing protein n=1 Tax=Streptomyces maoxianensis TaxID=1459942 RepID=UPI003AA9CA82